ncbi:YutD family protein [Candidatus Enterococcus ikei]|uniref:YutD family protein n=1 Tax=Candidatus Enterococcus ikei TaxID=2815326 RepID=A0ABS3H078_9ENTE|nr:YutD family protein [Enterococcus sp. DIV0869a]MBO0440109.1 YutD family protein [Enterococcus sp. DIV0869a]
MTEKVKKPYKNTKPNKHKEEPAATLTEEITAVLEEIKEEPVKEKKKGEIVTVIDDIHVTISERQYLLVKNHREAFDSERLGERFSDVLSKYDYIVGDWGYDQLRLKGFFNESNRKAAPEQRIDTLEDYLYEYCNFGCAYFVIERIGGKREKQQTRRKKPTKKPVHQNQAHTEEKRVPVTNKAKPVIKNRKETEPKKAVIGKQEKDASKGRSFTIRQREE